VVEISSPGGKSKEEVQDDVGEALRDGLSYDDPNNKIDVVTGTGVEIDGSSVAVVEDFILERALAYDFVGGG
jgi:hypothetical protein